MSRLRADMIQAVAIGSAYWASYLINGDASGLSDTEIDICEEWLVSHKLEEAEFVDCGEPYFSWQYGKETGHPCQGGDLVVYTILI